MELLSLKCSLKLSENQEELSKKKRFASKKEKEETERTTRRMLRREGTFNLYATDSGNFKLTITAIRSWKISVKSLSK